MTDEEIIREAQDRHTQAQAREAVFRSRADEDERFYFGDSENNYQWPQNVLNNRTTGGNPKPCLTINKAQQHAKQIINDAKQHKQAVKVIATGGGATYDASQVFMGLVRSIERNSNATTAYETGMFGAVVRGMGYWRVLTEYEHDNSMNQVIKIRRVPDPKMVFLDPDCQQKDGSDAKWAIVFVDKPKPKRKDGRPMPVESDGGTDTLGESSWDNEHHTRESEYWRKSDVSDELLQFVDGTTIKKSKAGEYDEAAVSARRPLKSAQIEQFLIKGTKIVERKKWAGKYIPIMRVPGEESVIDGEYDARGLVRALKDPQRSLNYYSSAAIEGVALQVKAPYIGPAEAIEGYENYWSTANTVAHSILPYNHVDGDGRDLPPPTRTEPAQMGQAFIEGLKIAQDEMRQVSGQYQAIMGAQGNETSGVAINARQRQSDNANYHFVENLSQAIRFTGTVIIDLIPHIYDTQRVERIMAEDGEESDVVIDPEAPQAHAHIGPDGQPMQPQQVEEAKRTKGGMDGVKSIFNPTIGVYGVASDVGPSFATTRQEGFNDLLQMTTQDPGLMSVIGDLMFRMSDAPLANEIADRLHAMVPPQALGGPSAEEQKMNQHISQQDAIIKQLQERLADKGLDTASEAKKLQIQEYDSETKRITAIAGVDPEALVPIVRQMVHEAMGMSLPDQQALHGIQPQPGAQDQFAAANAPEPATAQ